MSIKTSNLKQRIAVSALALTGLLIALTFASYSLLEPLFVAVVAGITGIALQEYYQMARRLKCEPVSTAAIFLSTIYIFAIYLRTQDSQWLQFPMITLAFSFLSLFVHFFFKGENPLVNFAVTIFGFVWITIPLALLCSIMFFFPEASSADGRYWFVYLLLVTNASDSGGYFFGKQFGKRKLAPKISPNKTIEGALGGVGSSLIVSLFCWFFFGADGLNSPFNLTFTEAIGLGLILGLMATLGDLAESLIKRDSGIKDSSSIPGLGGVLDMVDSLIFTAPVLYLFLTAR